LDGHEIIKFTVHDTGIGIAPEMLEIIFNEFQQGNSSVSRKYGGTGLGLSISMHLSKLMGGNIVVKSTPNLRSTFILSLPLTQREKINGEDISNDLKQKIADRLSTLISDERKALIVDDYAGNLVILGYMVEEIGLLYDVAHNGQEAIDMWRTNHYDIILIDVQMPIKDGLTAVEEIRSLEKLNNLVKTPIIGMTAHALVQDKNKCIQAGMDDYISKPIDSIVLKQKILHHIQKDGRDRRKKT
jgi:CheY-like chemotaxis protein